jgi:hypothetical protein
MLSGEQSLQPCMQAPYLPACDGQQIDALVFRVCHAQSEGSAFDFITIKHACGHVTLECEAISVSIQCFTLLKPSLYRQRGESGCHCAFRKHQGGILHVIHVHMWTCLHCRTVYRQLVGFI